MAKEKEKKEAPKQEKDVKPKASNIIKKRKKRWYGLVAPKEFSDKRIGETLAGEPNEILGRNVKINLMNLIDDYKRQGVNIKFKVESVNDDNAVCKTIGYEMLKSHARRIVRKGADKMDDSFLVQTKDGGKFRIKPIIVTRTRVSHPTLGKIRKIVQAYVTEKVKELSSTELFESVIQSRLQKEIRSNIISCKILSTQVL